jgi:hypothetical protein
MNIIAALEGAVAIGVALGEFIGAVADMSVDFVEQASGQTLAALAKEGSLYPNSFSAQRLQECNKGISFYTHMQIQLFEHRHTRLQ